MTVCTRVWLSVKIENCISLELKLFMEVFIRCVVWQLEIICVLKEYIGLSQYKIIAFVCSFYMLLTIALLKKDHCFRKGWVILDTGSPPSGRNQGNHGKCEKNLPDMEKSWNSISWEKSWKSHGNSNSGIENLFRFALQCLYYHIGRHLIKISLDPNMPCSLAEICAMTLYWL